MLWLTGISLLPEISYGQSGPNLIANPGFEPIWSTYNCGPSATPSAFGPAYQGTLENYWDEVDPWTVPEQKSFPCLTGAASSDHRCDNPHAGIMYASGTNREYISQPLAHNTQAGKYYMIEFYIRTGSGTLDNAGLMFSQGRPKQCTYHELTISPYPGDPDFEIDNSINFDPLLWTKVQGLFYSDNVYDWVTIGHYLDKDANQYLAIDDFRMYLWGNDVCPYERLIENFIFEDFDVTVQASDHIIAGFSVDPSQNPNGDVIVDNTSDVKFKAGSYVLLEPGFSTDIEAVFEAYIAPCGSDCYSPVAYVGTNTISCSNAPVQLGGNSIYGMTYSWTASTSQQLGYLSGTNISDPVFTPPSGSGTVTYTLTVTNLCNQTTSNTITIHYFGVPNTNPTVSLTNVNTSADLVSFSVGFAPETQYITIEVWNFAMTTLIATYQYEEGTDFSCCNFNWELPDAQTPCIDYKIVVKTQNYCSTNIASQTISWIRNRVPAFISVPNVITPNDDGANDFFCFDFTGAISYDFEVLNSNGNTVHHVTGTAYPPTACVWDGTCTDPLCMSPDLSDGTYYFILSIFGCDNQKVTTTGFVTLLAGRTPENSLAENTPPTNPPAVIPNPNNGQFDVINVQQGEQIRIYDLLGNEVAAKVATSSRTSFDLSNLAKGTYIMHIALLNGSIKMLRITQF